MSINTFDPKAIETALFNLITGATSNFGFVKVSRHARIWTNTGPELQPALYLIPMGAVVDQGQAFALPKYQLHWMVLAFTRASDDRDTVPQDALYDVWAAIDAAMRATPPGENQTLGGLVTNAWIDGQVLIQAGILDQQCSLQVPITAIVGI